MIVSRRAYQHNKSMAATEQNRKQSSVATHGCTQKGTNKILKKKQIDKISETSKIDLGAKTASYSNVWDPTTHPKRLVPLK